MIKTINFLRFRGFENLSISLLPHAYIVGPNSAGKSTVLEAIGLAEQCLKLARRKLPTLKITDHGKNWKAFPLPPGLENGDDPVRYNFGTEETRVSVEWENGSIINIVWPEENEEEVAGYFYLIDEDKTQPNTLQSIRTQFSSISIVPVVTPLDKFEELKSVLYVGAHSSHRLASRHFRNNLAIMSRTPDWDLFLEFCTHWLQEINLISVEINANVNRLVVFYSEQGSRIPKELSWAGDGMQIWVQLLWHIFRAKESSTIVLDEPEVYLHPDLQRRLVRLLSELPVQVILASHSADVIAEAPSDGILWVDRRSNMGRRAKSQKILTELSASLGTSYNIALARSTRAKLLLATDCDDFKALRYLCKQIGIEKLQNENIVNFIQLRDSRKWADIENLGESIRSIIPSSLPAVVLLQSDQRSAEQNKKITANLSAPGISVFILERPELENYFLDDQLIAKVSGAGSDTTKLKIGDVFEEFREQSEMAFLTAEVCAQNKSNVPDEISRAKEEFSRRWNSPQGKEKLVRGTKVISALNNWLLSDGYKTIDVQSLAKAARPKTLPSELVSILYEIENILI